MILENINEILEQLEKCCSVNVLAYIQAWAPAGIFPGGGQTFGGGPQKSVKGGPHIFFRQALKYAYRGGGGL